MDEIWGFLLLRHEPEENSFQPVRKQTDPVRCGEWTIVKTIDLLFHLCNIQMLSEIQVCDVGFNFVDKV